MTENTHGHRTPQNRQLTSQSIPLFTGHSFWNVTENPSSSDHCLITKNVQSKNSEPRSTIRKLNINKANWHLFTSKEAWKQVKNPNLSQFAEVLTEDFYIKPRFHQILLHQC